MRKEEIMEYDGSQGLNQEEEEVFESPYRNPLERYMGLIISVIVHFILFLFATLTVFQAPIAQQANIVIKTKFQPVITQERPQEKKTEAFTEKKGYQNDEPMSADPAVKSGELSDHDETANEEDFSMSKGNEDSFSDTPLQGQFNKNKIGVGGQAGGIFGGRFGGRRNLRAKSGSGKSGTDSSVDIGLMWLHRHQNRSGNWEAKDFLSLCGRDEGFEGNCSTPYSEEDTYADNAGRPIFNPSLTGLALLCFLGAGNSTTTGKYAVNVKQGVQYLLEIQGRDGCFGNQGEGEYMYNHAVATWAIAEAYALSNYNPMIQEGLQRAVDFLLQSQVPESGWGFTFPSHQADTSVTGWGLMALRSARVAGIEIPESAFENVKLFLNSVTASNSSVGYRVGDKGIERETTIIHHKPIFNINLPEAPILSLLPENGMITDFLYREFLNRGHAISRNSIIRLAQLGTTSTTLGSMQQSQNQEIPPQWIVTDMDTHQKYIIEAQDQKTVGVKHIYKMFANSESMTAIAMTSRIFMGTGLDDPHLEGGANLLLESLPTWGKDAEGFSLINFYYWHWGTLAMYQMGGNYWNQWNNRLVDVLVNKQIKTGCQCGSWSPLGKQCAAGGRIYATALNILSLEIYYRYGKVF
ncbi:MAG: hypothetical protein KBC30_03875 [Planctomycetes bacterium]|nr:hypothetical protein [Planctomycetota bacterium]HON44588.1 hypothetical protein [Planctomycetota bacterium]HPY74424.1 hypothetical protein [Planctomycetota bacterium]HQA99976.1 hypothetical protein [Planctomycetota bacterium]HRU50903.1 hypothetical protein [Planctomycetota bacterium]